MIDLKDITFFKFINLDENNSSNNVWEEGPVPSPHIFI